MPPGIPQAGSISIADNYPEAEPWTLNNKKGRFRDLF